MATCTCPSVECTQSTIGDIVYCTCTDIIPDITCPPGCTLIMQEDGNAQCECIDSIDPIETPVETLINFDNTDYFRDVSFTISYKPDGGGWSSYYTFYPDYSNALNGYFQAGYNWGIDRETLWDHTLGNKSFGVFQGKYNPWVLEFPIQNENVDKILNSLEINIEARRYTNEWDYSVHKDIGVTDLFVYNATNNSGKLILHNQKSLTDVRKYPYVLGGEQHILSTSENGKQKLNYIFNRMINQDSNVPMFQRDSNNIFKEIDSRAVKFGGKKITERMKGETFIVSLSNTQSSQFQILVKNLISDETVE